MSRFDVTKVPLIFSKALEFVADCPHAFDAAEQALKRGDRASAALLKAAVAPISTTSAPALVETQLASDDFISKVRPRTIMGRMTQARRAPYRVGLPRVIGEAQVAWVGENGWTPAGKLSLDKTDTLFPRKVGVLVVLSQEILRIGGPLAQQIVDAELTASAVQARDVAFIDPDNAGIANIKPASILNGISARTSSGDPAEDIATLVDAYTGSLDTAVFVMSSKLAVRLALYRDSSGGSLFPFLGASGGEIAGIDVIASDSVPNDTSGSVLALVDQSGIMVSAEESAELRFSTQADVQMTDNATGAAAMVSMYQSDSVAVQVTQTTDWARARPDAVVWTTVAY